MLSWTNKIFPKKSRKKNETVRVYNLHIQATNVWMLNSKGKLSNGGAYVWRCSHEPSLEQAFRSTVADLAQQPEFLDDIFNHENDPIDFWLVEHEIVYLEDGYTLEGTGFVYYCDLGEAEEEDVGNIEVEERDPSGLHMQIDVAGRGVLN
ncbi:MAG: hypothetical protein AAF772_03080 [Acidobacteriota bacterium]